MKTLEEYLDLAAQNHGAVYPADGGGCGCGAAPECGEPCCECCEPCCVRVVTDSRYVVETMSGRFRRKSNLEWWERLDKAARPHKISWEWVKGHAAHTDNNRCDVLANRAAREQVSSNGLKILSS